MPIASFQFIGRYSSTLLLHFNFLACLLLYLNFLTCFYYFDDVVLAFTMWAQVPTTSAFLMESTPWPKVNRAKGINGFAT